MTYIKMEKTSSHRDCTKLSCFLTLLALVFGYSALLHLQLKQPSALLKFPLIASNANIVGNQLLNNTTPISSVKQTTDDYDNDAKYWRLKTLDNAFLSKNEKEFWASVKPRFKCPFNISLIGPAGYHQKWVCGMDQLRTLRQPCVVYSFGVGDDSTFEADMRFKTGCHIFAYDPTVDSIGAPLNSATPNVTFQRLGFGGDIATLDIGPVSTLKNIMRENSHTWIDVLKVDVEGFEFEGIAKALADFPTPPFGQLLTEFHGWEPHRWKIIAMIDHLDRRGLKLIHEEINPKQSCCSELVFYNVASRLGQPPRHL